MKEAVDRIQVGGVKLPKLKGKTTIILKDENGKEQKRIVSENMVTNAVAKIWQNNFANTLDVTDKRLLPIKNMFGGVMCFQQTINESAGNIFAPDQGTNPLIAHAGDYASTTSANPKLGTLDATNSGEITNGYRWQWFFNLSQGVGKINCCCLTSALGGNIGLTPVENTWSGIMLPSGKVVKTGLNQNEPTIDTIGFTPIRYNRQTGRAYAVFADSSTFTEIELEQRTLQFGLNSAPLRHSEDEVTVSSVVKNRYAWKEVGRRSVAIPHGSVGNFHVIVTDGTDYWIFQSTTNSSSSGASQIVGSKIVAGGTDLVASTMPTITGGSFATLPFYSTSDTHARRTIGRYGFIPVRTDGNHKWMYFPNREQNNFYKVDLNNVADISLCTSALPQNYVCLSPANAVYGGNILYGYNFIINNDTVYPMAVPDNEGGYTTNPTIVSGDYYEMVSFSDTPSVLVNSKYYGSGSNYYGYLMTGIIAPYLATINNLESEVEKTLSQTMSIIYELVEVQ